MQIFQPRPFRRVFLTIVVLFAACFVAGPAQAATSDVACSLGGTFRIEDIEDDALTSSRVLTSSTSNCAGTITVPADVTVIGDRAFTNRLGITSVTFQTGSRLKRINYQAFYRSSITSIVLPNGLEFIGDGAFAEAENFTAISIPGTVTQIENYAFVRSDLRSLVFESRIANSFDWGHWLLLDNRNLESVTLKGPNKLVLPSDSNFWGDNVNNAKNWDGWSLAPSGPRVSAPLTYADTNDLILYPRQTLKDGVSVVPCSLGGTVKIIEWRVHFVTWDCAGEVTIPASVIAIDHYFRDRNAEGGRGGVTRVTFEANSQLRTINGGVFQNTAITTISIPGSVESIRENAFGDSDLETVVFEPRTAASLNITRAFTENKKLRSITFSGPVVVNSSPAEVISKPAYNWVGWSSVEGGPIVSFPLTVTATNGATLYSKFTANPYVVTYDATGGTAVAQGSALGDQIAFPTPPTRAGYTFDAWYDSPSDWSRGPVTRWIYNNDATLYAKWTPVAPPPAEVAPTTTTTVAPTTTTTVAPTTTTTVAPTTTTTVAPSVAVTPPAVAVVVALPLASTPLVANKPLSAGGEVSVTFSGFVPGEFVQLIVASTPRVIGSGYADSKGMVTLAGNMPAGLVSGSHTLAVFAPVSGIGFKQPITVTRVTVTAKNLYTARALAKRVGITIVSPNAKVTMTVASSSKKNCAVVAANLKALKAGNCVVTFTVQEPKPANGKQPKATKSIKTLVVKQ